MHRREHELAERGGCGDEPERKRPPLRRHNLAKARDNEVERATRQPQAHKHAHREGERSGRGGIGHEADAERIKRAAAGQYAQGADAVGDGARHGLKQAPQQVLQRERKRVGLRAPAVSFQHRQLQRAGGRARPPRDHCDQAARDNRDLGRNAAHGASRFRHAFPRSFSWLQAATAAGL